MYGYGLPGGWPGGRISWYYNPANRPANLTDEEIIASVSAAFAAWNKVCQVEGTYMGLSSVAPTPRPADTFVVGWTDFGSTDFQARAGSARNGSSNYRPFTGGSVELNTARAADYRTQLDNPLGNMLVGVMEHELGHVLGLTHSDDPNSVMFSNPYNHAVYQSTLQGDDIAACADLYGGRGLANQPDLRSAPITSPLASAMQTYLSVNPPHSGRPAVSLAQVDASATGPGLFYSITYWNNLPQGIPVYHRWITPNGNAYFSGPIYNLAVNTGYYYSSLSNAAFHMPGRWAAQLVVGGEVATNQAFEVTPPNVAPVQPFEMALLGERDGVSGQFRWRAVPYGRGGVLSLAQILVANGQAAATLSAPTASGSNSVAFWLESDRPRYKTGEDGGQSLHSYDVVRRASFNTLAANGVLVPSPPAITVSGNAPSASVTAQLTMPDAHDYDIYVAVLVGDQLLFRSPKGWSPELGALVSAHGPAVANVDLMRNYDIRTLPAGSTLWVGWGRDVTDMLAKGQLALARVF